MCSWELVTDHPRFTYGKFAVLIRGMVSKTESDGSISWCIADYRDGTDRRNMFAGGWAETIEHAMRAAENAAAGYARKAGRPPLSEKALSSTQRNRLRMERLIAKENAADLADEKLSTLYYWLRGKKLQGIAPPIDEIMQQVEAIRRKTALTAFSTYCGRMLKLLLSNSNREYPHGAETQIRNLVERIQQLGKSANKPIGGRLPDGADIFKEFTEITNQLKQYGFIADASLVSAVHGACFDAKIPGPQYADGQLRAVYEPADDWEVTPADKRLQEISAQYRDFSGREDEYRDDLMFYLLTEKQD